MQHADKNDNHYLDFFSLINTQYGQNYSLTTNLWQRKVLEWNHLKEESLSESLLFSKSSWYVCDN